MAITSVGQLNLLVLDTPDLDNEQNALKVRRVLDQHGVFALSIHGGAGCGKTSLLEAVLRALHGFRNCAAIVGDVTTRLDGGRIAALGVPVVQINTSGSCHLNAGMILEALPLLDLGNTDLLFIEDVGDMHAAPGCGLGEHFRAACLPATCGLGMLEKYPAQFAASDFSLITKADLALAVGFDVPRAVSGLRRLNPAARVLVTDAFSGDGVDMVCRCIHRTLIGADCAP